MRTGVGGLRAARTVAFVAGLMLMLAGCATPPGQNASLRGTRYDPRLGVSSSEKVIADGDPVPRGGGSYLTGRPYTIAGRSYVPQADAKGYAAVGTASWYGDAFHGRRTANGEIFDKGSISAAHPTLPLPSYVRVTNLANGMSMIVRVNDRGPYHGGRVMDVSQRVAETLDFKRAGTARIRVEYVGRAALSGSDDARLMATLRTDGGAAQLAGMEGEGGGSAPSALASLAGPSTPEQPSPAPTPVSFAQRPSREDRRRGDIQLQAVYGKNATDAPLPPSRPFDTSRADTDDRSHPTYRTLWRDIVAGGTGRQG